MDYRYVITNVILTSPVLDHKTHPDPRHARGQQNLPETVREEFEAFLRCGVLENGALRVVC